MTRSLLIMILSFFLILIILFINGLNFYKVRENSMSPALHEGNRVMVDTMSLKFFGIKQGDIIVYRLEEGALVVKRFLVEEPEGYFFIGDNREVSNDSRHYGPINKGNIVGKVIAWAP